MKHKTQAAARELTEKANTISQSRFCRSCNSWRKPEHGVRVQIGDSQNSYWRCKGCSQRRSPGGDRNVK